MLACLITFLQSVLEVAHLGEFDCSDV